MAKIGGLLSTNMYAYCTNNPVNLIDSNGYNPVVFWLIYEGGQALLAWAVAAGVVSVGVPVGWEIQNRYFRDSTGRYTTSVSYNPASGQAARPSSKPTPQIVPSPTPSSQNGEYYFVSINLDGSVTVDRSKSMNITEAFSHLITGSNIYTLKTRDAENLVYLGGGMYNNRPEQHRKCEAWHMHPENIVFRKLNGEQWRPHVFYGVTNVH